MLESTKRTSIQKKQIASGAKSRQRSLGEYRVFRKLWMTQTLWGTGAVHMDHQIFISKASKLSVASPPETLLGWAFWHLLILIFPSPFSLKQEWRAIVVGYPIIFQNLPCLISILEASSPPEILWGSGLLDPNGFSGLVYLCCFQIHHS